MNIDLTNIIEAIITLLVIITTTFVIPWIKSKTTPQQRKEFIEWVKIGVMAAEQIYKGSGRGGEKKNYVIDFLQSKGFTFDEATVNNALEAAVKQLNTEGIVIE